MSAGGGLSGSRSLLRVSSYSVQFAVTIVSHFVTPSRSRSLVVSVLYDSSVVYGDGDRRRSKWVHLPVD
jgi:hypothetical protein